jgi:hypothetical protein
MTPAAAVPARSAGSGRDYLRFPRRAAGRLPQPDAGRRPGPLLEHLATLTRNQVRFADAQTTVSMLAKPTSAQREAFDLIGVRIPLTLK